MPANAFYEGVRPGPGTATVRSGTVDPEGTATGSVGDVYLQAGGRVWLKETGTATTTGWKWIADSTDLVFGPSQCPVSWGIDADNVITTAAGTQVAGLSGVIRFMPIEIGPTQQTFDALAINVTGAESGGAGVVHRGGIYSSVVDGSAPNLNGGLLGDCGYTITTTGQKIVQFASPITSTPGRYWLAWYNYWTTAPSTFGIVSSVSNALNLPRRMSDHASASSRAITLTGQTSATLPNAIASPTFAITNDSLTAHLLMRRSA